MPPFPNMGPVLDAIGEVDKTIRANSPKCPKCGRPDGGVTKTDETKWEAGLVDRKRCPEGDCPMRDTKRFQVS